MSSASDKKGRLSLKLRHQEKQHLLVFKSQPGEISDDKQTLSQPCSQPCSGLSNLGNTCYCNAVVQALRHCPGFTLALNNNRDNSYDQQNLIHILNQVRY